MAQADKSWRKTHPQNLVRPRACSYAHSNPSENGSLAMTMTRRQAIQASAAFGAVAAFGAGSATAQSGQLIQKRIPKSGEMLPPIGIGTNQYGVGATEEERAPLRDTMARFVEMGGKVMDTAMIYGTSEAVIGDLAEGLNIRDKLVL